MKIFENMVCVPTLSTEQNRNSLTERLLRFFINKLFQHIPRITVEY